MSVNDFGQLISKKYIDWDRLKGKTVYITGATGIIGSSLVYALLYYGKTKIVVQVRNEKKARKMFGTGVEYVVCDLLDKPSYVGDIHYIVHCANPTSSKFFVNNPVETINLAVNGTKNILDFSKEKRVEGFIFLSTMEVYGSPKKGHKVKENECGSFDPAIVRNCYPLSKQICESLCVSYVAEYGVHARIVRLTQTFGPGINFDDDRVFAEFARCAVEKKNIVLRTKGETERVYLYSLDAVSAILTVMMKGKDGEIYTAANDDTYCSIYEMAQLVADMSGINVVIEEQDIGKMGYANTIFMNLDTSKLRGLGWKPEVGLKEAYERLFDYLACYVPRA